VGGAVSDRNRLIDASAAVNGSTLRDNKKTVSLRNIKKTIGRRDGKKRVTSRGCVQRWPQANLRLRR
tara:strand:+ start:131796 stop:131996 length:201 start_codon:yes stop_codon:yes gene_type:complete